MPSKVFAIVVDQRKMVAITVSEGDWHCYLPSEIETIYSQSDNLRTIASRLGITPLLIRKALRLASIDYLRDLYKQYQSGTPCAQLAAENGLTRSTLTKLFKQRGWQVKLGMSRPRFSQYQIAKAAMEHKTINAVARNLKVHWETAKTILKSQKLLTRQSGRYVLVVASDFLNSAHTHLRI
ncbi:hypothetical protein [Leisingera sp. M658]|uniref:hypothetical protein n=1 Tax=Leisingera sp. M658 TaxID=2867015 RepID=UPI0021A551A5|nr:hypothetical protein [Leisingera sp. M658]UWQ74342.1 hypothetical protein K3724_17900 [Leisingera sp. M658]